MADACVGREQTTTLSREAHYTRDLEKATGCAVGRMTLKKSPDVQWGPILHNVAEERSLNITQFK